MRKNLVQSRSFAEMLERTIRSYQNRTLESAEVIAELIKLAEEMREAQKRGEKLNLTEDEIAFYDALEVNDSAVKVLGDETLKEHCPRTGGDGAQQCNHRLDGEGIGARQVARDGQADFAQVRLSARQTGKGHPDRVGAGGADRHGLGGIR